MIPSAILVASPLDFGDVAFSHVWQDDVTVVGYEIVVRANAADAHLNADGDIYIQAQLSRQATPNQPGTIGRNHIKTVWTAAITVGQVLSKDEREFFPEGYGWEFDEGESINLLSLGQWIGAGGDMACVRSAIVYYVERN